MVRRRSTVRFRNGAPQVRGPFPVSGRGLFRRLGGTLGGSFLPGLVVSMQVKEHGAMAGLVTC